MRKKKNIIIISSLLILFIIVGISIFIKKDTTLKLKNTTFIFEYGEKVPLNVEYYVDEKNQNNTKDSKIKIENQEMFDTSDNEIKTLNSKYLNVGSYNLSIVYKNKNFNFTIEVKDTTAPEFVDFKNKIEIEKGTKNLDLSEFYEVKDLNSTTIVVESDADVSQVGEYKALIKATDYYGNITEKEATVIIFENKIKEEKVNESQQSNQSQSKPVNTSPKSETNNKKTNDNINNNSNSKKQESDAKPVASATYREDISNNLVNKINKYRKDNGLPELPVTSETQAVANQRAKEIVTNPSHDGSVYGYGENIGGGGIGTDFFELWKNSFAHNNTLLRDQNTTIAVSVYQTNNMWYAVAVFKLDY